jgi:hypothetical protein
MKTIISNSKQIISIFLLSVGVFSCSEDTLNQINEDKDHPKSIQPQCGTG